MHIPNGGIFAIGMLSVMTPAIMALVCTGRGVATKLEGARPNGHIIIAPVQTC